MIRTFLCEGDKAGEAVIVEGLDTILYVDRTGRHLRMATVGMKTYCHACGMTGFIGAAGPRLHFIAGNGEQAALSGDVNMCKCKPAPIFSARRSMTMLVMSEKCTTTAASVAAAVSTALSGNLGYPPENHGASFLLRDSETGTRLANRKYISEIDGIRGEGLTDSEGYAHIDAQAGQSIRIHVIFASPRGKLIAEEV